MLYFEQTEWWSQKFTPRYKSAGDWPKSTQHTTDQGTYLLRGDKMCDTQYFKLTRIYRFLVSNSISAKPCQFNVLLLWKWSQSAVNLKKMIMLSKKTKQLSQCETTVEHHSACRIQDKCGGSSFSLGPLYSTQIFPSVCLIANSISLLSSVQREFGS